MDYEKLLEYRNTRNLFPIKLGIFAEEIGPGYARVTKTVEKSDLNAGGGAHGGLLFTIADTAAGTAMASYGHFTVTVSATYNYLRGAKEGDILTSEARVIKQGNTLCVLDVTVKNQNDVLIGTSSFTYYMLDGKLDLE